MAETIVRWISSDYGGGTTKTVDISSVEVAESMIVVQYIGSQGVTITPPEGWTELYPLINVGSRASVAFFRTKLSSTETEAVFVASASLGGWPYALIGVLGAPTDTWITGPFWTRPLHGTETTNIVDGVTTLEADSVALVISLENSSAMEDPNSIVGVDNGFSEIGYQGQFAQGDRLETIWAGTKSVPVVGDVGDTTITYQNLHSSNGGGIMVAFPPVAMFPGRPIKVGDGSSARLSYIDALGERRAPASVRLLKPGFNNVEHALQTPGATISHRGGTFTFPDMSEYAYDQSVLLGHGILEGSWARTSDGWWFGCNDVDLNVVSGQVGLPAISSMTRAEVESYSNILNPHPNFPSRPFFGLEEFLEKYGSTHILMMDPAFAMRQHNTEFMMICESIVDPTRLIWKYHIGSPGSNVVSNAATAARDRGWGGTWCYAFPDDIDNGSFSEHSGKAGWSMVGMAIFADQSYWDITIATGKPVIGHFATSQDAYDEAINKGSDMVACQYLHDIKSVSI